MKLLAQSTRARASASPTRSTGYTLVELLVVIGIIAILIGLLMPTMGVARQAANRVRCAAGLRTIAQGLHLYATAYKGALPGSPFTSGAHIRYSGAPSEFIPQSVRPIASDNDNTPGVVSMFDWVSPIAKAIGYKFNEGPRAADRKERFLRFLQPDSPFVCISNDFVASAYGGSANWGALPTMSYTTSIDFMLLHNSSGTQANSHVGLFITRPEWNVPAGYVPKLSKIGSPSTKVFLSEGARFVDNSNLAFTYNSSMTGSTQNGGSHADQRLYVKIDYNRSRLLSGKYADKNSSVVPSTARAMLLAYRHGARKIGLGRDSYKMNLLFFDGHAESATISETLNPALHSPKGTRVDLTAAQVYPLTYQLYNNNKQGTYVVP